MKLAELEYREVRELLPAPEEAGDMDALEPGDEPWPVMVGADGDLLDGFHRVAGYEAWVNEGGDDEEDVRVIVVYDETLTVLVADPNAKGHEQAIDLVLALVDMER